MSDNMNIVLCGFHLTCSLYWLNESFFLLLYRIRHLRRLPKLPVHAPIRHHHQYVRLENSRLKVLARWCRVFMTALVLCMLNIFLARVFWKKL